MSWFDAFKLFISTKATLADLGTALIGAGLWTAFDGVVAHLTALGALVLLCIRIYIGVKEIRGMKQGQRRAKNGNITDRKS